LVSPPAAAAAAVGSTSTSESVRSLQGSTTHDRTGQAASG
jgi:hypothetical protein